MLGLPACGARRIAWQVEEVVQIGNHHLAGTVTVTIACPNGLRTGAPRDRPVGYVAAGGDGPPVHHWNRSTQA